MTNAAAGWYDDGSGRQRWWDGAAWTEHYAPPPPPSTAVAPTAAPAAATVAPPASPPTVVAAAASAPTAAAEVAQDPTAAPVTAKKRRRRDLVIGLVAGGVVLALVGGGAVAWAQVSSMFGGSSSPEAAVQKAVDAAASGDPMRLFGTLAPSEINALRPALERLGSVTGDGDVDYLRLLGRIAEAGDARVEGVTYESYPIAPGVAAVTAVSGTITFDGDPARLADAIYGISAQVSRAAYSDPDAGYAEADVEAMLADQRGSIEDWVSDNLPFTVDIAETTQDAADGVTGLSPWTLVAVDEGGWYVSPVLSLFENEVRSRWRSTGSEEEAQANVNAMNAQRGTSVAGAASFASPEDAAAGVAEGISAAARGDFDSLAAALSLPERRLVALYGPMFFETDWLAAQGPDVEFDSLAVTAEYDGDSRAAVSLDDVATTSHGESSTNGLRIRGTCWEWTSQSEGYYSESEDYYDDGFRSGSGCLEDWAGTELLDINDNRAMFVKVDGGWVFSPLETVAVTANRAVINLSDLVDTGRLGELWQ